MTHATRTLSLVGASLILGGIGLTVAGSADGSDRPVRGGLAPLDSSRAAGWTVLASFGADQLSSGRVVGLDLMGDSLLLLQSHSWSLVVGGQLVATHGSAVTGSPTYLSRAEGIAFTPQGVAVLDAPRHRVTMWSPTGERLADRPISRTSREVALHRSLTPSPAGVLVSSWVTTDSGGYWLVQRLSRDRAESVPLPPGRPTGESHNAPELVPLPDSGLLVLRADSWHIGRYTAQLDLVDSARRIGAAHYAASAPLARRMRGHVAMMPEAQRRDFLLGEALPSLRAATITDAGELLVLTARDDVASIAELVRADGRPIASLWSAPDSSRMFAVRGAVLRVREEEESLVIERLQLRPRD